MDPCLWNLGKKRCGIKNTWGLFWFCFISKATLWEKARKKIGQGLWFALHLSGSLSCAKKMRGHEESGCALKSPGFESWLLHFSASASTHLILSFFSNVMGTRTSTSQSYCDSKNTLPHNLASLWGWSHFVGGWSWLTGVATPLSPLQAISNSKQKPSVSTLKQLTTAQK